LGGKDPVPRRSSIIGSSFGEGGDKKFDVPRECKEKFSRSGLPGEELQERPPKAGGTRNLQRGGEDTPRARGRDPLVKKNIRKNFKKKRGPL